MATTDAPDISNGLALMTLRGGMNNTDSPHLLPEDQCVLAQNVEWFFSTLGERRAGCAAIALTSASLTDEDEIVHISEWLPTNSPTTPEWWVIGTTVGTSTSIAKRLYTAWTAISPSDAPNTSAPDVYSIKSQALNGLLFWAYRSAVDRMHVWDKTVWRRSGLRQPDPPTGANHGAGAYATVRYFRVRYTEQDGSAITIRRSEPSTTLSFTPSGAGDGATITKPAAISESETHWEVEASTDNANFYRIATVVVGTTTYLDTTAFATGYTSGTLSAQVGTYALLPSAKFISVDGDRLLLAGHWTDATKQSTVWWTPVSSDPTAAGNSERLPLSTNNYLNLDNYDGGGITGISDITYGTWYVFKWSRIYQLNRTGDVTNAYSRQTLSASRGAIPGSIVNGIDEWGSPCVYFLDPQLGPSRIGQNGIQTIRGLRTTWVRMNQSADIAAHGVFYGAKQQVHWWLALDGATTPNYKIILHAPEVVSQGGDARRGWAVATGRITEAFCSGMLTEQVFEEGALTLSQRPFIGLTDPDFLQRCDTNTVDAGVPYVAILRSRPYIAAGLLNKWGTLCAAVMATAMAGAGCVVRLIRNFGLEESDATTLDFSPEGEEEFVIRTLENLTISNSGSIQVEISDE